MKTIVHAVCLGLLAGCAGAVPVAEQEHPLGGIEGTFEYALDAPWRIEPSLGATGLEFGAIPIQVSIHDTDVIPLDAAGYTLGNFCSLAVTDERVIGKAARRSFSLAGLEEIERSLRWASPTSAQPTHDSCRPAASTTGCENMRPVANTAEWHAVAWYTPAGGMSPGADVPLTLEVILTRSPYTTCATALQTGETYTLRNYVTVHLGEQALPRFGSGWLYGDLHYHSQGTDNEGESAYNYRGVIRALGALGIDFVFAAEHASDGKQIIDGDLDGLTPLFDTRGLRDMSLNRFRFLQSQLRDPASGIDLFTAMDGPFDRAPQGWNSHRVIPQIFLGGELDAIPETSNTVGPDPNSWYLPYGNGLSYFLFNLCGGWNDFVDYGTTACVGTELYDVTPTGSVLRDVQGFNEFYYGREHLVYMPASAADTNGFVSSGTSFYGGATRRLAETHENRPPLLPEIDQKGYVFLAHPLNAGLGTPGPDGPPVSQHMMLKAWAARGVLGLQLWNEPVHLRTAINYHGGAFGGWENERNGDAYETGYGFQGDLTNDLGGISDGPRKGFTTSHWFELSPYFDRANRAYERWTQENEVSLHHGVYTWDQTLLWGLDTGRTSTLSWLPAGEPRRFFIAAGSDAHGDLNYRRTGYLRGTAGITDTAIAKARNLVFAGAPTLPRDSNLTAKETGRLAERHSQEQVVQALAQGVFAVTDGPALRIVVDRNRNGLIDATDTPMGGIVDLFGEKDLPLIVEWLSTPEFGGVTRIDLYVGVRSDYAGADAHQRIYAPDAQGPRAPGIPGSAVTTSYVQDGLVYARMEDGYWRDPTADGLLRIRLSAPSSGGRRAIGIPLDELEAARAARGDRFFVRAFAETEMHDESGCITSDLSRRKGACIRHYAFTNPVWAVTQAVAPGTCPTSFRAIDQDGDGLPDGCDPCPANSAPLCGLADTPPVIGP